MPKNLLLFTRNFRFIEEEVLLLLENQDLLLWETSSVGRKGSHFVSINSNHISITRGYLLYNFFTNLKLRKVLVLSIKIFSISRTNYATTGNATDRSTKPLEAEITANTPFSPHCVQSFAHYSLPRRIRWIELIDILFWFVWAGYTSQLPYNWSYLLLNCRNRLVRLKPTPV